MASSKKSTVSIIGSLNIDFVTVTPRMPLPGETLAATSFTTGFGGKGANQAVGASRLADHNHVQVRMIGNVGDDSFGADYLAALTKEGIETGGVRRLDSQKTGVTNIVVEEESGENRILYVANANQKFGDDDDLVSLGAEEGVVVFQLEIPLKTVLSNATKAREKGLHVILNPAPAVALPESSYEDIDTLIMNETEAAILSGQPEMSDRDALLALAKDFLQKGVREAVIITLGGDGLVYATAGGSSGHVGARKVKVVDTTAAGDTFVGGYAVQRARHSSDANFDYEKALAFATLAASKTVQKAGAMASIPHLSELDRST